MPGGGAAPSSSVASAYPTSASVPTAPHSGAGAASASATAPTASASATPLTASASAAPSARSASAYPTGSASASDPRGGAVPSVSRATPEVSHPGTTVRRMDFRTDRLGLLLDQLRSSVDFSRGRFEGLTDDEYLWEPARPAWSVRRRGEAPSALAFGSGDWVLDHDRDPEPPPVTTIAWRLTHLIAMYEGRWHWTFGPRATDPKELLVPTPVAKDALDQLWSQTDRWLADAATLTDEQLDTVGFGQCPWTDDAEVPFITVIWEANIELIHHMAEIALLRDLYRTRPVAAR